MYQEGSYCVKVGEDLPYIGEVKSAVDIDGQVSKIIVHKIIGLSWTDSNRLCIDLVVETEIPKESMQKHMKSRISVLNGKKKRDRE